MTLWFLAASTGKPWAQGTCSTVRMLWVFSSTFLLDRLCENPPPFDLIKPVGLQRCASPDTASYSQHRKHCTAQGFILTWSLLFLHLSYFIFLGLSSSLHLSPSVPTHLIFFWWTRVQLKSLEDTWKLSPTTKRVRCYRNTRRDDGKSLGWKWFLKRRILRHVHLTDWHPNEALLVRRRGLSTVAKNISYSNSVGTSCAM